MNKEERLRGSESEVKPTIRETVYNWADNKQPGTTSIHDLDALVSALEWREMQEPAERAAKEGAERPRAALTRGEVGK